MKAKKALSLSKVIQKSLCGMMMFIAFMMDEIFLRLYRQTGRQTEIDSN